MSKLDTYREFLAGEGYRPQACDDFVSFRHEGGTYLLPADDNDPGYFRVVFPNFWPLQSDAERARALAAASLTTASLKGAKVFVLGSDTSATVEVFLADPEGWRGVFRRSLMALQSAASHFRAAMTAPLPPGDVMALLRAALGDGMKEA